jgi:YebC/PmpR family DNA-binding regulatory protein
MLVECLTDNLNRTASDLRATFAKGSGNLGTPGSVKFIFLKKGSIQVKPGPTEERVLEQAIEAGAEDVINHGEEGFEVRTEPSALHAVALGLEKHGVQLGEQKLTYVPSNTVKVEGEPAKKLLRLIESLEDNDDVQNVHANFEMDEALLAELSDG